MLRVAFVVWLAACGGAPKPAPDPIAPQAPEAPPAQSVGDTLALGGDPCEGGEVTGDPCQGGELKVGQVGGGSPGTVGRGTGVVDTSDGIGAGPPGNRKSGPTINDGDPVVSGSLDKGVIRRVVKAHMSQIRFCYVKLQQAHPDLEGKVVAKWMIDKDGSTRDVVATGVHPDLETCLANRIKTWKFPKIEGGAITVSYPFIFQKGS